MTNPLQPDASPTQSRIKLPTIAGTLFVIAPILMLFGGFLGLVHGGGERDYEIFQTKLGTVGFWIGMTLMMTGFILVGVRAIAQQQLDLLRGVNSR